MEENTFENLDLKITINNNEENMSIHNEEQLDNKIFSEEKMDQTTMKVNHTVKDIQPKPILSYNPDELRWNSTHTINLEHTYCYCAQDRTLDEPDFQCRGNQI